MYFMKQPLNFFICLFILVVISTPMTVASVTLHNESIVRTYVGGATIQGIINISFSQEPADAMLSSLIPGGMSLLEFLQAANTKSGTDYSCNIQSCEKTYVSTDETASTANIGEDDQAIGFVLYGKDVTIQTADFLIASEVPESCSPQLNILALDENESMIANSEYVPNKARCQKSTTGCFSSDLDQGDYKFVTLSTTNYCNNVTLDPAPAYYFETDLRAVANTSSLVMKLFGTETESLGSCTTPVSGIGEQKIGCIINKSITKQGSYFMCISAKESKNEYEIRFETQDEICGGAGVGRTTSGDYELHAIPLPYAPLVNISLARSYKSSTANNLAQVADQYLEKVYARDCSAGCVIPFSFGGIAQILSFQNVSMVYVAEENYITDRTLYIVDRQDPILTSNRPLSLDIAAAKFILPLTAKWARFNFNIGNKNLLGTDLLLNVTPGFDFDIAPRFALPGVKTTFSVITSENISEVVWDFGDGSKINVNGTSVAHLYLTGSNYTIRVTLKNTAGVSVTRQSDIIIGDPKESFSYLFNATQAAVRNISLRIALLPSNLQPVVNNKLNTSLLDAEIKKIQGDSLQAVNTSEYDLLVQKLLSLSIPSDVAVGESGKVPIILGLDKIDTEFVQALANTSVPQDQEDILRENLIDWNRRSYGGDVSFSVISVSDKNGERTPLLTHFVVTPEAKVMASESIYFVIDRPLESIIFLGNPDVRSLTSDSVSGVAVSYTAQPIEFYLEDSIQYQDLGAHFVPALDVLGDYREREQIQPKEYPTGWVVFWLVSLILFTSIMYIILQEWYKRHYENYLFRNPDDLFNILTFIDNSRASGMEDNIVRRNLNGSSWTREQISYAFKKIDGKRTGMFEIPIFRNAEKRKIQDEIQKRKQRMGGDARFIKRPFS